MLRQAAPDGRRRFHAYFPCSSTDLGVDIRRGNVDGQPLVFSANYRSRALESDWMACDGDCTDCAHWGPG